MNRYQEHCLARGLAGFERKGGLRMRPAQYLVGILAARAWDNSIRERSR